MRRTLAIWIRNLQFFDQQNLFFFLSQHSIKSIGCNQYYHYIFSFYHFTDDQHHWLQYYRYSMLFIFFVLPGFFCIETKCYAYSGVYTINLCRYLLNFVMEKKALICIFSNPDLWNFVNIKYDSKLFCVYFV